MLPAEFSYTQRGKNNFTGRLELDEVMRIISGVFGGRAIQMNGKLPIRPTSDKARGAVFSSLAPHIEGARFLDICAGTGAMGLEALSRGALLVKAIERSQEAAQLIMANRQALGTTDASFEVIVGEFGKILPRLEGESFDIIFADPPYGKGYPSEILILVGLHSLLAPGGHLVIEHFTKEQVLVAPGSLRLTRTKKYGQTQMSFFILDQQEVPEGAK